MWAPRFDVLSACLSDLLKEYNPILFRVKNLVLNRMSRFWFAKFAPRKSAPIMSRQYARDLSVPNIRAAVSGACSMTGIRLLQILK